jgi:hypothetical protein
LQTLAEGSSSLEIRDLGEKNKPRIEGIAISGDLANDFGHKIRAASPTVQFSFGNPPLKVPDSTKVIFVVHIPQSLSRPHMFEGQFWYRTNRGNELMSYDQVREAFLHYEERRYKIQHLYVELLEIQTEAKLIRRPLDDPSEKYPVLSIDTGVLNSLVADTYDMIQDDPKLISNLFLIRRIASIMTGLSVDFRATYPLLIGGLDKRRATARHNANLQRHADDLFNVAEESLQTLQTKYNLKNSLTSNPTEPKN